MATGPIPLAALRPGYRGEVVAMVVRRWSIYLADDKYLGIDYVLADVCGNALHCSSKADVADTFVGVLKVGVYASFRLIDVRPNLNKYRVLSKPDYMLQLTASTEVRVLDNPPQNIRCPYFDLTPIEDIKSDDKNTLVDVMGLVTNLRDVQTRYKSDSNKLRKDTKVLDFVLRDNLGATVRITLWDQMIDQLLDHRPIDESNWVVVLVAMNPRPYKTTMCLSSTSATHVYHEDNIPEIAAFKGNNTYQRYEGPTPEHLTLSELAIWCRQQKPSRTFKVKISISDVDRRRGWYYRGCTNKNCKKGVVPHTTGYFCKHCSVKIEAPSYKYLIKMKVHDESDHAAVTFFDEPCKQLLGMDAETLFKLNQADGIIGGFPPHLIELINTAHVIELPSNTYDEQDVVTYSCNNIVSSVMPGMKENAEKAEVPQQRALRINEPNPALVTPRKKEEMRDIHVGDNNEAESKRRKLKIDGSVQNEDDEYEATSDDLSCTQP